MNLAQAIALVFRYGNVAAKSEEELLKHIKDANVKDGELKDAETRCLFAVEQAFYEIRKRLTVERQQREQAMATAAKAGPAAAPIETANGEEVTTSSGRPPVVGHKAGMGVPGPAKLSDGQNVDHWVLSEAERKKGFVEPVRCSYQHLKCGVVTRMPLSIGETYARNPKFYGATFCCGCKTYLPVGEHGEFVWEHTDQKVGTMREKRMVKINGEQMEVSPVMRAYELLNLAKAHYESNLIWSNDKGVAGLVSDAQQFIYPCDGDSYTGERKI